DSPSECSEPTGFAWELVRGVFTFREKIDATISKYSQNWRLERIGHIELTLLRLAVFELLFHKETPPKVVINEALELSTSFGTLQSKKFINGILDAAIKDLPK
ncbi:MAG: transcription antitermination factor NusB, partial [Desulfovibrio sp.]|nr:transcription antitermination factor NusB [Desulfovibrio sp.]